MNPRITDWLNNCNIKTPTLIIDLEAVQKQYQRLQAALGKIDIHYALKANSEFEILKLLAKEGASFDVASPKELDLVLQAGTDVRRISYGHCVKKSAHIAYAWQRGVRLFAFDSMEELEKIAKYAPYSEVFCRLMVSNDGAKWPLTKKFGCSADEAVLMLKKAQELELTPAGLSFHVGSQQENPKAYIDALNIAANVYERLKQDGILLDLINIGGGFPCHHYDYIPSYETYGKTILDALDKFDNPNMRFIAEPGRAIVAEAGILVSEVILTCEKQQQHWAYLDVGTYSGLVEASDQYIHYCFTTDYPQDTPQKPYIIAGPSCDAVDILYEKHKINLPAALKEGDRVYLLSAGAYTTVYATKEFNGFEAPSVTCIPLAGDMPLFSHKIIDLTEIRKQKKRLWGS